MSALIHFIGLLTLVTANSGNPHIVIPRFNDIIKKENNIIRVPTAAIASQSWANTAGPDGFTDFYIDVQTITISGVTNPVSEQVGPLPRLTCCCTAMKAGLATDYNDANPDEPVKKSAYIPIDRGDLFTFVDTQTSAVHLDLSVEPVNNQITITGTRNKKVQTIVINAPPIGPLVEVVFLNRPDDADHDSHWHHYYRMAKVSNTCMETPKNDPSTCGPSPDGCLLTDQGAAARTAAKPKSKPAAKLKSASTKKAAAPKKVAAVKSLAHGSRWLQMLFVDINCSSSQWP